VSIPLAILNCFDKVLKASTFSSKVLYVLSPIVLGLFGKPVKKSLIIFVEALSNNRPFS